MITQCTAATPFASFDQRNVLCANPIWMPNRCISGAHNNPTCSPCMIEFVDTNAPRIAVRCMYFAAFQYQTQTDLLP